MVLELIFPDEDMAPFVMFLSIIFCTALGLMSSVLLFGKASSFVSVAFVTLILYKILEKRIRKPMKSAHEFSQEIHNYMSILSLFFLIFVGVFLTYLIFSLMVTDMFLVSHHELVSGGTVYDMYTGLSAGDIFLNNLVVFLVCLAASFLFGLGTVFLYLMIWNASVLGVVFAQTAIQTVLMTEMSIFIVLFVLLIATLPHVLLEMLAYLLAGTIGQRVSDAIVHSRSMISALMGTLIIFIGVNLLLVAALLECGFAPMLIALLL